MASPQTLKARAGHKLPVEDQNEKRLKLVQRAQWLRAAILGANDGLLSTTSLMLGVGAAKEDQQSMIFSGLAGAIAGACSMALGEFVSVSTQRDIEKATICHSSSKPELCQEDIGGNIKLHITTSANGTTIIDTNPATRTNSSPVPPAMTPERKSPLIVSSAKSSMTGAGQGEEEEESEKEELPNPYKAAAASALSFLGGSVVPLIPAVLVVHSTSRALAIVVVASIALALFGVTGAYLGGSRIRASAVRVLLGGWISMAITYGLLKLLDKDRKGGHDTD